MSIILDNETSQFIYNNCLILNDLPFPTEAEEQLLKYYIEDVCMKITIRTNRNKFPTDLKYLAINLVNQAFNLHKIDYNNEQQSIQSMSETGRSVTFGETDNQKTKYQLLIEQQLKDNELLINRYRLLYKTRCPYEQD